MSATPSADDRETGLLIGELARLAGVTVKAVRHYEKLGLLAPTWREANGYRRYSPELVVRVACIARLRSMGVPLSRVGDVLDSAPAAADGIDGLIEFLQAEKESLAARIEGLVALRDALASGDAVISSLG